MAFRARRPASASKQGLGQRDGRSEYAERPPDVVFIHPSTHRLTADSQERASFVVSDSWSVICFRQTQPFGLMDIARIHGRPHIAWDNVEWNPAAPEVGYCPHPMASSLPCPLRAENLGRSSPLTPNASQNLTTQPHTKRQQTTFAFPTGTMPTPSMPGIVNAPIVQIQTPSGLSNVSNPLMLYRFQQFPLNETLFPPGQSGEGCLTTYNTTVRFPVNGVPNCEGINANLGGSNLKEIAPSVIPFCYYLCDLADLNFNQVFRLPIPHLRQDDDGRHFPNFLRIRTVKSIMRLEVSTAWTRDIWASFHTLFLIQSSKTSFLAHANTDRLFALWQAINPASFPTPEIDSVGTFTNTVGENSTIDTPLTLFMKVDGTAWASAGARELVWLRYSYPEILDVSWFLFCLPSGLETSDGILEGEWEVVGVGIE
ncbi:hypothetical protein BDZ45DRAFT_745259 [Acephala macrosclerotiorum]|nr:hypothetical protein BDZ45DRAFT_745259 [Acephala macrosclerotiorum]